ncbi:MAG: serine protease [Acidobacteriota bacterium]|nr:serine protease [Acidobacteriota bacterium]
MALFPPEYLDAVVAIGTSATDLRGTGFLYRHAIGLDGSTGRPQHLLFLVTNHHVVAGLDGLGAVFNSPSNEDTIFMKIPESKPDGTAMWTLDEPSDIAVCRIPPSLLDEWDVPYAVFGDTAGTFQTVLSRAEARVEGITEGSPVAVLGFPLGLAGERRHYTIVRNGSVARIRDWFNGDDERFLIDCLVFPGNSGGPVVSIPDRVSIEGTSKASKSSLLGMVCGYRPYQEYARSTASGRTRIVFEENSGLAVVLPVEMIQQVIQRDLQESGWADF